MMLKNANGRTIATGIIQAQGNWMTESFVPFRGTLRFPAQPAGSTGMLILDRDNPSDLPSNDATVKIPVTF